MFTFRPVFFLPKPRDVDFEKSHPHVWLTEKLIFPKIRETDQSVEQEAEEIFLNIRDGLLSPL